MTLLVSDKFNVNNHAHLIKGSNNLTAWFYWIFAHRDVTRFLTRQGAGRYKLTKAALAALPCPIPRVEEQRAIAVALSDVDTLIGALDRLIAKKRDLKQAAMQQLLTGQTRLPGFTEQWELRRLTLMGRTYGGLAGKVKKDFGAGTSQYVPFMNVMTNVQIDSSWLERVNVRAEEKQNPVRRGDLLFNGSSETPEELGMCGVVTDDLDNTFLNSFCFGFRFWDATQNGKYFAYYFRSSEGRKLLYSLAQGATRYNLSKTALLRLELPVPLPAEQTAITAVLSDMDAEITALEQRRDKTRLLKQGMMQELLTGRTRLV
jgi:type I restriction enzyme S subunit